jgi:translation initiation factor 3 subunit B
VTPEKTPFKEIGNLCYWLLEEDCNDQYAVVYNAGRPEKIAICYNTPVEPRIVCERERWTETYLRWSPKGSYLTTFHSQGVALWGTEKFERIGRFSHSNAQLVDFSPCERYLVTFSSYVDDPADPQNIIIWDIRTGKKKRTFSRTSSEEWPVIKWSFDGSYFAKKGTDYLSVYEVPSFGLLDKKSIVVKGIKDFQWSPSDHLIAYWLPELGEYPSKIIIMRIPNRQEIATKSRHLVSDCKLQWHKQGDYLCVRVDHWVNKSKKNQISCFEIFHTKVNETPIDSIEMKENVIDFSLEPNGNKLAIIHGEPPTRISVRFYKINDKGMPPTILKTFEKQPVNTLFWSPAGQFIVLAGLKSMDGLLEFVDTSDMSLMHKQEHTKVSDILWDPTGRYVVSSLSYWTEKSDTGYIVWSFQGKLLHRSPHYMEKFCQLLWRPRPPSLLTEEDIKTIKRDFKKYQYLFEQKDRNLKTKASKGLIDKRKKDWDDYKSLQERKKKQFQMKLAQFTDYMKILESKLAASKDIIEVTIKLKEKVEEINA